MTITLQGEPRSTNHVWQITTRGRFARMFMTKLGWLLKESYIHQARSQWHSVPLQGQVEVYIKLYFGTKRKADIDNYHKLSLDSLNGIVYDDDSQIQKMTVEKLYCKENPRIELTVC